MSTETIENEIAKIDLELCMYLSKNDIPFKLTEQDVFIIETTKCTEDQKNKIIEIEEKKRPFISQLSNKQ